MARDRATVRAEDHAAALATVTDWAERQAVPAHTTAELLELVGMVAAAIADGRARALAPTTGPVRKVEQVLNVSRRYWTPDLRPRHEAACREAWASHLQLEGLRPVSWPPIMVTAWAWGDVQYGPDDPAGGPFRQVPVGSQDVELLRLTITGEAVAE